MQFNPACLHGPNILGTSVPVDFTNTQGYSEGPPSPWHSGLNMPLYGIYNASYALAPDATQVNESKKNSNKRSPPTPTKDEHNSEEVPRAPADDKFQGLDDEQKQKRQRRLMKNREAAQQFRQRQKEYIQNLEQRVTELNTHVSDSHKHIEMLTAENRLLRDQLVYLYNVMRQNLSVSTPMLAPSFPVPPQSVPPSPAVPPTPPPSPCSPYVGANTPIPIPTSALTPPQQMIDLSSLGFKGYTLPDGTIAYDVYKVNPNSLQNVPQTAMNQNAAQHVPVQNNQPTHAYFHRINQNPANQTSTNQITAPHNHATIRHNNTDHATPISQPVPQVHNMPQLHSMPVQAQTPILQASPEITPGTPPGFNQIGELGSMKLDLETTLLLSRMGGSKPSEVNEAQTVPVFVKAEGSTPQ